MTLTELSKELGVSDATIRQRWIAKGCPHSRGKHRSYIFHLADVQTWIKSNGITCKPGMQSIYDNRDTFLQTAQNELDILGIRLKEIDSITPRQFIGILQKLNRIAQALQSHILSN